jgi:HlyD family secretion protein
MTFTGRVTEISQQAEFTPRNVQTPEERVKMVFAVKVTLPNTEGLLKPGMPADAVISTAEATP